MFIINKGKKEYFFNGKEGKIKIEEQHMKKKNLIRIGIAGVIGLLSLAGCDLIQHETDPEELDPSINQNECVYGPPPEDIFKPENNMNEDVYGPPEDME